MLELEETQSERRQGKWRAAVRTGAKQIRPEVTIGAKELNPIPPGIQQLEQIWPCDAHQVRLFAV
jgi:hypothetical protein